MTAPLFWKDLCLVRDGAADVVSDAMMRRLIDHGFVTLGRALTDKGRQCLARGDAEWRGESPPLVPDDVPIRAWRQDL